MSSACSTLRYFALFVLASCAACGGEQAAPLAPKSESAPTRAAPEPKADAKPVAKRTLTRPELQQLLDTWLKAQNDGDFAAYEALYAPDMRGVKRVGERESRMDRVQWMADRARMFRKKMEVEVHSVSFRALMATAAIEFVQVFHSGKFMDTGSKKLMVAMHDGAPRIMHEEMLSSDLLVLADAFQDRVYLTFQVAGATYVALSPKAEPGWGAGDFVVEGTSDTGKAYTQRADASLVPRASQWLSTPFNVYDDKGVVCSANIADLKVVLLADEYFLDEADEERIGALSEPAASDQRARAILRKEPAMLAGKLSSCSGEIAMPASEPAPAFYLPQAVEPALEQAVIAASKALPKYKELEATWRERTDQAGEWDSDPEVALFGAPSGPRFALATFGDDSCASPMPELLFALYRVDAQGGLTLARTSSQASHSQLLLDLNADGSPEVLGYRTLYGFGSYGLFRIQEVLSAYNGCSC
jgi:hypothetical protein